MGINSADPELVDAGMTGPDKSHLLFDMRQGPDSAWNNEVINILAKGVEKARAAYHCKTPPRSHAYLLDLVRDKYKRVRASWKRGQPQKTEADVAETPQEVEARLIVDKNHRLATARKRERRVQVNEFLLWLL
jgi:hypothetical protein